MNKILNVIELALIAACGIGYQFLSESSKKEIEKQIKKDDEMLERKKVDSFDTQKMLEEVFYPRRKKYKVIWYGGSGYLWERDSKVFNSHEAAEDYKNFLKEKHPKDLITIEIVFEAE